MRYRSNIPAISEFLFRRIDPDFSARAKEKGGGFIVAGANYGQGSSREHAALAPTFLGIRAKIAKSFARIHRTNLINYGIVPLLFKNPSDYEALAAGKMLRINGIRTAIENSDPEVSLIVEGKYIPLLLSFSNRERAVLLAGGELNFIREKLNV